MSFGYSVGDAFLFVQLAWKTVQNSRKACGEHDELTREVSSLHLVIRRLEKEVSRSESPINRPDDTCKEELRAIVGGCEKVLQVINKILEKYNSLSEKERSAKKLWQRVRFGNGELADMRDLREKLTYYTSALSLFVNMISMGSIGRVEEQMENAGGDIKEIRIAINGITAHLMSGSHREGSVLTTYADDDKAVWKEFRKELIEEGFLSSTITKHKRLIKAYVKELGDRGLLDDEDPHNIKNLSEEDGANIDDHATPSIETESLPKAASKFPSKMESDISEDDLSWATGNSIETTPRIISDTGSFSDPIRTRKSSGSERMEEERKKPRAYKDEGGDCRRIGRREREAEQAAEETKRDRRIKSRDKDRRRDVDLKSREKFVPFVEDDNSDPESDRLQEEKEKPRGYENERDDRRRRIMEAERAAERVAEAIQRDQRIRRRDRERRRDVESKSRSKFESFVESYVGDDGSDSEFDDRYHSKSKRDPPPKKKSGDEGKSRGKFGLFIEDYDSNSEVDIPSSAPPQPTQPPKKPSTPTEALTIIADIFHTNFLPQVRTFIQYPPRDEKSRYFEYKKVSETILTQTIMKLDGVETEGNEGLRVNRRELVRETQGWLKDLDRMMGKR